MLLCLSKAAAAVKQQQGRVPYPTTRNLYLLLFPPFAVLFITTITEILFLRSLVSVQHRTNTTTTTCDLQIPGKENPESGLSHHPCSSLEFGCPPPQFSVLSPPPLQIEEEEKKASPYHNWQLFNADYQEMLQTLKIFVYPDAFVKNDSAPFSHVFFPHSKPMNPKIGNYFSEHAFKLALLHSSLITHHPEEAHFFFMPFSINVMRNHPLLHSESSISDFIARYILRISFEFKFWNASGGTDHFFVCCHSVGREAASRHFALHNNAIQITCSSSYFQRLYTAHKDIALPQIWPRHHHQLLNPPNARNRLVFFAGRVQNSRSRKELITLWGNDTAFSIFSGHSSFPYEEGFRSSKYCLHIKGYEVNTARISDAIHYGCIPVLISDHYDLPFANILDWRKFSIIVSQGDVGLLKYILTSGVSDQMYLNLYQNLCTVRKHFRWYTSSNAVPMTYDSFHMTAYQLWLRRGLHRMGSS